MLRFQTFAREMCVQREGESDGDDDEEEGGGNEW